MGNSLSDNTVVPIEKYLPTASKDPNPGFSAAWEVYPHTQRRSVKAKSFVVWRRRGLEALNGNVLAWIEAYAVTDDWRNGFVPGFQVFIGERRGMDFSEPPEEQEQHLGRHPQWGEMAPDCQRRWLEAGGKSG